MIASLAVTAWYLLGLKACWYFEISNSVKGSRTLLKRPKTVQVFRLLWVIVASFEWLLFKGILLEKEFYLTEGVSSALLISTLEGLARLRSFLPSLKASLWTDLDSSFGFDITPTRALASALLLEDVPLYARSIFSTVTFYAESLSDLSLRKVFNF